MLKTFRLFGFVALHLSLTCLSVYALDISDLPLETAISTPPPVVMIVFDNSRSMDLEFSTTQAQGLFEGAYYLFPDDAYYPKPDHAFGSGHHLRQADRRRWRSQWAGFNQLYYNPRTTYKPWVSTVKHVFNNADLNSPLSRPVWTGTGETRCRMSSIFFTVNSGDDKIDVLLAHYFTYYDSDSNGRWDTAEPVYLVTWADKDEDGRLDMSDSISSDQRRYFRVADNGEGLIQENELIPVIDEAEKNLIRATRIDASGRFQGLLTDKEELQNYANWFTYYRKREYVAKAVAAKIISSAGNIQAGIYSVNPGLRIGAKPINLSRRKPDIDPIDGTAADLINALYELNSCGSTPLRYALDQVGRYLHQDYHSELGMSPYFSNADGGSCQSAYAIVISDGLWNDDFSGVGNADGDSGKPYADTWTDTLADIAMAYYKNDLGSSLQDRVPKTGCDQSDHQHLKTYVVSVGYPVQSDVAERVDSLERPGSCPDADPNLNAVWTKPLAVIGVEEEESFQGKFFSNDNVPSAGVMADLRHAALNGRGRFVSGDSAIASVKILPEMLAEGVAATYASNLAVNATSIEDDVTAYQMTYRSEDWSGDVSAYSLAIPPEQEGVPPVTTLWRASEMLTGDSGSLWDQRRIVTYGGPWLQPQGIAFRYDQLSTRQLTALGPNHDVKSMADSQVMQLIDYLRGKPDSKYRDRKTLLGDIAHSTPAIFGRTLFVGANDGMLHAFDTDSGTERFAYIPALVFGHLKELADERYGDRHRFYVDGPLYVGEVTVDNRSREAYLIGGLGKGGKGYFCLSLGRRERSIVNGEYNSYHWNNHVDNITQGSPEELVASLIRWEYPQPDQSSDLMDNDTDAVVDEPGEFDPNIGFSFSQGYAVNANCPPNTYRPVVIFGNGYGSESKKAMLYILDADTGKVIRIIDTGSYPDNGLSTPALIDVDLDRRVDYAYAGDLNGNLWKFDLTATDPARWGVAFGDDVNRDGLIDAAQGDLPAPLFQAAGQPITGRPNVMAMHGDCLSQAPGFMVFFGTGKYLGISDRTDLAQQSLYGIWDYGDDSDDSESLGGFEDRSSGRLSSGLFLLRKLVAGESSNDGRVYRQVSTDQVNYEMLEDLEDADGYTCNNSSEVKKRNPGHYAGWFLDFPSSAESRNAAAERMVGDVLVRGGKIIAASYVPENNSCESRGRSWLYLLKACNGNTPLDSNGDPLLSAGYDGKLSPRPQIIKDVEHPGKDLIIMSDHAGRIQMMAFSGEQWGRVYWRQSR